MSADAEPALHAFARLRLPSRIEVWQATNFVDRLYLGYFLVLSGLVLAFQHRLPHWPDYLLLHAVGFAVVVLLAVGGRHSRAVEFFHDWYPVLAFIVLFEEVARLSLLVVPVWRDPYILEVEARLFHTPPTDWLRQFASPAVTEIMEAGYFSYFLYVLIVGGVLYAQRHQRAFREVMSANVLAYSLCYIWFILFPTQGPAHTLDGVPNAALPGGPFHWAVLLIQQLGGVQGNAFPSSHVAAGFASVFFAWRYLPRLGAVLTPFLALLCLGAVYDGYHYLSDVAGGLVFGALAVAMVLSWERLSGGLD